MAPPDAESEAFRNLRHGGLDKAVNYVSDADFKEKIDSYSPPSRIKTTLVVH